MTKPATIKTTLNRYYFDVSKEGQAEQYAAAMVKARATGFPCSTMARTFTQYCEAEANLQKFDKMLDAATARPERTCIKGDMGCGVFSAQIELETNVVFGDQWNSAPIAGVTEQGLHLFPWAENVHHNRSIKSGYWLDQTDDMRRVTDTTYKCGYCGHHHHGEGAPVFCPACIDSPYLTADNLHLTRMLPVKDGRTKRAPLTAAELAERLPVWREAQTHGATARGIARIKALRDDVEKRYAADVAKATEERDSARWLLDHAPGLVENHIFYSHTGKHCFGWRNPIADDALYAEVVALLSNEQNPFPFKWEIQRTK